MRKSIIILLALALALQSAAQNVNPTVQVTNDYQTRMSSVSKMSVPVNVPDSLYDFDYEFDYSVFDSPYRGAYEFSPYAVKMTPSSKPLDLNKFYLKAGAGYTLHPELEFVFSPFEKGSFDLSLFGKADGYYGKYNNLDESTLKALSDKYDGHDFSDNAGVRGQYNYKRGNISFEVGHDGVFASMAPQDDGANTIYNSIYGQVRAKSSGGRGSYFFYDACVSYRYGAEQFHHHDYLDGGYRKDAGLKENDILVTGSIGPVIASRYRLLIDAGFELVKQNDANLTSRSEQLVTLAPKFQFALGPVEFSAGARMDYSDKFRIAPDVHAQVGISEKAFVIYADLAGGDKLNTYHSYKTTNHHFDSGYETLDNSYVASHNPLLAQFGVRGGAGGHFQFDVNAGYGIYQSVPFSSALTAVGSNYLNPIYTTVDAYNLWPFSTGAFIESIRLLNYNAFHAELKLGWHSERFDADADVLYRKSFAATPTVSNEDIASPPTWADPCYDIPAVSGDIRLRYNINGRIFFGVTASGQTKQYLVKSTVASDASVPQSVDGFVDLGVFGEYKFGNHFNFWVKGGNLLCQPVRRSLTFVDKSPFATVGISLTL